MIVTRPILAPCRPRCRAAFRRVVGGVLVERGRGLEEINHGRTPAYAKATAGRRTTLANVCVGMEVSENAERRCTCGEAVRLPEAEGRAAKRSQEAARSLSVLVCGSYERLASVPMSVAAVDKHAAVTNGKYVDFIIYPFVNRAVGAYKQLAKLRGIFRDECECAYGHLCSEFGIVGETHRCFDDFPIPPLCILWIEIPGDVVKNRPEKFLCVRRPFYGHAIPLLAAMRFILRCMFLNTSSAGMPLPSANSRREAFMSLYRSIWSFRASMSSAFTRYIPARPFCVTRMERCSFWTRVMMDESLFRHSENGTMSSDGRQRRIGRSIVFAIILSPVTSRIVQYSGGNCQGGAASQISTAMFKEAA